MTLQNKADFQDESQTLIASTTGVNPNKKIPIVEIFGPTIQGEGPLIGRPTHFIRFGLCDYRCTKCDSMHAVDPVQVKANARWLTQEETVDAFYEHFKKQQGVNLITFSGGNPCIHDLGQLVQILTDNGHEIAVETQGTFSPEWLELCDYITVSPKGPGMGEKLELTKLDAFIKQWGKRPCTTLKFVVFDQRDIEVAAMLFERYCIFDVETLDAQLLPRQFVLSQGNPFPPGSSHLDGEILSEYLLEQYRNTLEQLQQNKTLCNVRFLPQLHVLLWGNRQGV